jgi:hypothetical protein
MNTLYPDAVYGHILLIEERLQRALALTTEAREAMRRHEANPAIGTLLPMQEHVSDVDTLLKSIFVLHRHASRPRQGGAE